MQFAGIETRSVLLHLEIVFSWFLELIGHVGLTSSILNGAE